MKRHGIATADVPSATRRRAAIESELLPRNIAELVETVSRDGGEHLLWNFFESGETVRYGELRDKVFGLAAGLQSLGVKKGTHVGVMLPNVAAMPLTWLAIGVLGAVMIPINPGYRERELVYVLTDSETTFIVTEEGTLGTVTDAIAEGNIRMPPGNIVVLGGGAANHHSLEKLMAADLQSLRLQEDVGHDDLLNIQYTSGTTGFPKGCMLTQRYWLNAGKVNAFRDGKTYARILASTPFFYMDPQWLLLMTMYQRGTLFVAARQSGSRFMTWIRDYKIEFCLLPVITLKQPKDAADQQNCIVRANVYGIAPNLHREIEERFDLCAREAFGMTEVGPTMYMPIEAEEMVGSGSCGIPCPFRECRVVDGDGKEVPAGTIGELVVRGPGILKGYYNNPQATAAAFYDDWFRTGDLFRQDERGYFYIVGRVKESIRRAGENIAAREVEAVLLSFEPVLEAAAIPQKDDMRGEEVRACIIWQEGVQADQSLLQQLIDHCQKNLASFKVPRFYTFPQALPKTSSGKIAKHKLVEEMASKSDRSFDRQTATWVS
jgi:acyl-coenzyme A synthetase/AMP-(fatty) acid ligase